MKPERHTADCDPCWRPASCEVEGCASIQVRDTTPRWFSLALTLLLIATLYGLARVAIVTAAMPTPVTLAEPAVAANKGTGANK